MSFDFTGSIVSSFYTLETKKMIGMSQLAGRTFPGFGAVHIIIDIKTTALLAVSLDSETECCADGHLIAHQQMSICLRLLVVHDAWLS